MTQQLPKAELHVHIEGTLTPQQTRDFAKHNDLSLPSDLFSADGNGYAWHDFVDLVTRVYDTAAATMCTTDDYRRQARDYLLQSAREGVIYTEFIVSADHARRIGMAYGDMLDAIATGIDEAEKESGIIARMNTTLVRHLPIEQIEQTARDIIDTPHPYVRGLDIAGAEQPGDLPILRRFYEDIQNGSGLSYGVRLHSMENTGPESGQDALSFHPTRIGHGVRAIEDEDVLDQIQERGITLEVCPTSNVLAGLYDSYKNHPLRALYDQGLLCTISSDDPGLFGVTIGQEYEIAQKEFGFSDEELKTLTRNAIKAAFVHDTIKDRLLKKLDGTKNTCGFPRPQNL